MAEYEAYIMGLKMSINKDIQELLVIGDLDLLIHQVQGEWSMKNSKIARHTLRLQNDFADALSTISSLIKHPNISYINPLEVYLKEQPAHCSHVEAEPDGIPWYFDIKKYLEIETYPDNSTFNQKKAIRRMANNFFPSGEPFIGGLQIWDFSNVSMPLKLRSFSNRFMREFVELI
ncbi:uncharacterized protein LOC129890441 [Solanum dulcamara]|uniref:uncharacterized protein LOC129890441 n=1 Tax=Solanum dulcamara TaxID=45834 RepID=UPI0024864DEF|nr:uncharacterized protein LOC129890441 [Solanum dulcamara]